MTEKSAKKQIVFCSTLMLGMFSFLLSVAQVFYSVKPDFLLTKSSNQSLISPFTTSYPDTNISNFHNYSQINFLGNIGLTSPNYLINYGTNQLGFQLYQPQFTNDYINANQVRFYQSIGPYVNLTGLRGNKNFQGFKMLYTQTFNNKLNVALKFNRYSSQGYYLNQRTVTQNFAGSSHYANKSNRLGYYFFFLSNENKNEENGGLKSEYLNATTVSEIKNFQAVKLSDASRLNKDATFFFNPWLRLNKLNDSNSVGNHFLQLKSTYSNKLYWYNDRGLENDQFYTIFFFDSTRTNDSTRLKQLCNEINYTFINQSKQVSVTVGYKNELNLLWQKSDTTHLNHIVQTHLSYSSIKSDDTTSKKGLFTNLNLQFVLDGENKNNYKLSSETDWWLNRKKNQKLSLFLLNENRNADYLFTFWKGNNFKWNNNFKKQNLTHLLTSYQFNALFKLSFIYQNIQNFLYFNTIAQPAQLTKAVHNAAVSVDFNKVFFNHIGFSLSHTFQSTSHDSYLRLPHHLTSSKLFYQYYSKVKLLQLQIGTQLQVFESFRGYSYMPATHSFYLNEDYKTSASTFLDFYLNVRIRPVTIFLRVENILQGLTDTNYSFVKGYYQPERAFRFGINWVFFD
jgi:hypothetical protein